MDFREILGMYTLVLEAVDYMFGVMQYSIKQFTCVTHF